MSDLAIRVEGLSKQYRIGERVEQYYTLRDSISELAVKLFSGNGRNGAPDTLFWALKDISFDIKQGEVIGIIGPNGAGKTTLLKILSRITEPTKGRAEIRGRVASLLEVGTGFHHELTGRENIYLNGAILGMRKAEIVRKFDEIVAFAGVERFIDTPIKHYSTGMHLRLAFAVAAHLEPDIMLVDEVLAVGDADFQKKCLGKMQDVASEGRTVLFVSHNMRAIQRLCGRGIVLDQGTIRMVGAIDKAVEQYLGMGANQGGERTWKDIAQAPGDDVVRLLGIRLKNQRGEVSSQFDVREPVRVEIEYLVMKEGYQLCAVMDFVNPMGQELFATFDNYICGPWGRQAPCVTGSYKSTCIIPGDFLNEGIICFTLNIFTPPERPNSIPRRLFEPDILCFTVTDSLDPGGVRGNFPYEWGVPAVRPRLRWLTEHMNLTYNPRGAD